MDKEEAKPVLQTGFDGVQPVHTAKATQTDPKRINFRADEYGDRTASGP
ncbi:hypothetical protein [Paraburkholderia sp. SIMBA_054]